MVKINHQNSKERVFIEVARNSLTSSIVGHGASIDAHTVSLGLDQKFDFAMPQDLSSLMDRTVRELKLRTPRKATILLLRAFVSMRVVEMPLISQKDLASAVNLEMESSHGEEASQLDWDFLPLDSVGASNLNVLIVSAPKSLINGVRTACQSAGLEPEQITLSEFGYSRVCPKDAELVHLLALRENRVDAVVVFRGSVIQTQSMAIDPTQASDFDRMNGLLRRLHSSLPESIQNLTPSKKLIVVREDGGKKSDSGSIFEQSLVRLCREDGFNVDEVEAHLLYQNILPNGHSQAKKFTGRYIDLAHPKMPSQPPMSPRGKLAIVVAFAVIAAIGFWCWQKYESTRLAKELLSVRKKMAQIDKKIASLDSQMEAANKLGQWDASSVHWGDLIRTISENISERKDLYVVRLQMDNQNYQQRSPLTRIEGRAKSTSSILQLNRDLGTKNPLLSVQPNGIEPNSVDPEFTSQFRVEISDAKTADSAESGEEVEN